MYFSFNTCNDRTEPVTALSIFFSFDGSSTKKLKVSKKSVSKKNQFVLFDLVQLIVNGQKFLGIKDNHFWLITIYFVVIKNI